MARDRGFDPTGSLPDPAVFKEYDAVAPGAARMILDAFAEESRHRRQLEMKALDAQIRDTWRGQLFGLIIGVVAIVTGGVTASLGAEWPGGVIGSAGVIGLVSVFVFGRQTPPDDTAKATPGR